MKKTIAFFAITFMLSLSLASAAIYGSSDTEVNLGSNSNTDSDVETNTSTQTSARSGISITTTSDDDSLISVDSSTSNMINVKLSNGLTTQVAISPSVAAEIAAQEFGISECSEETRCEVYVKEENDDDIRAVYEVQYTSESKVFGIFKADMTTTADIDAQTGVVLEVEKPWWAGFAIESNTSADVSAAGSAAYK